jgi:small-conductance mechanosensitive channel
MRALRFVVTLLFFSALPVCVAAQGTAPEASVRIDRTTLFVLHSGIGSIAPAERAQLVNHRLEEILKSSPATIKLHLEEIDVGWLVSANDRPVISVTETDAQSEGVSSKALAERWAGMIQEGLQQTLRERMRRGLWWRIGITLAVILAGFLFLWALHWSRNRLVGSLEARRARIPSIHFRGLELVSGEHLRSGLARALWIVYGLAVLLVAAITLLLVFSQFPQTSKYAKVVFLWMWNPFVEIVRGVIHYLPNLFYILVIILVTRLVLRAVGFVFEQAHRGVISLEPWFHRDVARPTSQILKAILVVLALFFIAPLIPGTGSTAAKGISVILGLMVSFGSTSTVGNLIAGIVLTYMRPFQIGERVKLGETVGDVVERTFFYTKVLTIKNEEVVVPSLQTLSASIVNYSAKARQGQLILHTTVTIGYDAPWRRVHELLLQAADRTAGVLKEPKPFVLQTALNDFYVAYQLNVYTDKANNMANAYAELHQNIQDSFNEGGVEICSPHFYQLRDGNATTIPTDYLKNYEPPRFLVDARVAEPKRS